MTAMRRPVLRVVDGQASGAHCERPAPRVQHDARGNAIWVGEVALQEGSELAIQADLPAEPTSDGDPYNRAARGTPRRSR